MATLNGSIAATNSTAANFRLWASYVHAAFLLGLVDTLATGSIDLTTVAAPTNPNQAMGFKVYRFDDTLQATKPVFLKIEFGSGTSANPPSLWFTIGTTHDGAGTIGGVLQARTQISWGSNSTTLGSSDASGDVAEGRVGIVLWSQHLDNSYPRFFFLERSKSAGGASSGVGLITAWGGVNSFRSQWLEFGRAVQAAQVTGVHVILSYDNPSTFGTSVGVSLAVPMGNDAKQPGITMMFCRASDFGLGTMIDVNVYGTARSYLRMGNFLTDIRATGAGTAGDTNIRLMMLYE